MQTLFVKFKANPGDQGLTIGPNETKSVINVVDTNPDEKVYDFVIGIVSDEC